MVDEPSTEYLGGGGGLGVAVFAVTVVLVVSYGSFFAGHVGYGGAMLCQWISERGSHE